MLDLVRWFRSLQAKGAQYKKNLHHETADVFLDHAPPEGGLQALRGRLETRPRRRWWRPVVVVVALVVVALGLVWPTTPRAPVVIVVDAPPSASVPSTTVVMARWVRERPDFAGVTQAPVAPRARQAVRVVAQSDAVVVLDVASLE